MKRAPKTPALAKLAMLLLFTIAAVAILETTSISAQEIGKTITSPFGIVRQTSTSESGTEGDTFVDPETGEVGHIIRNPFGVANPEGVDTGIDIPDSEEEEVGVIITSPFGVPASDDIDTGVDVFDEDEEYLISLPEDEESEAEDSEDVDGVDDETSDDEKEIEEESAGTTTEKYVPVIDNPIRGVEFESISLAGTSTYTVESETNDINNAPTLYVHAGENLTLTLVVNQNLPTNIQPIFRRLNQSGVQNPFGPLQSGSNPPYCFVYHVPSAMYEGTYSASISYTFNGVQIERVLKIEIVYFELKIDYSGNGTIDDDDVYDANNPFGKLIHINNLDFDRDGIPDYADGFQSNCIDGSNNIIPLSEESLINNSLPFEKIKIRVSKGLDLAQWRWSFDYNKSNLDVKVYGMPNDPEYRTFEPGDNGTIRLWTKNGNKPRSRNTITNVNQGDFIPNNTNIPLAKFANNRVEKNDYDEYTLYVEAVKPLNKTADSGIPIKVSLKKGNIPAFHFDEQIYVTPYQIVFEGITNDKIASSHVVYNPCGIIKRDEENGEEAKFIFDTIPSGIPCTTVNWSASDNLTFVGGNTGKSVTVCATGDVNSEFTLTIDIGRGNTMNPSIKGKILDERTVKLFVWVITDNNGNNPAFQRSKIDSWIDEINQVYKQVGIKFEIAATGGFNNLPDDPQNGSFVDIDTEAKGRELVNYPQKTGFIREEDGLEIFFVAQMTYARGLSFGGEGIIIPAMNALPNDINFVTLAHELGHACGLNDIYDSKKRRTPTSTITYSINNDININSLWIKNDCTYARIPSSTPMSVAGYYKYNRKHVQLLERLMMYGYGEDGKCDFSRGDVYGINKHYDFGNIKTGLENMNRNPIHNR